MKKRSGSFGNLSDAIAKAWSAFESPDNQARLVEENEAQVRDRKVREKAARLKKLLSWGVPRIAAKLIVDGKVAESTTTDGNEVEWNAVREVNERPDATLLVLAGNSGCGKTVAACTRIEDRETGCLVRAADFVELGNSWADKDRLAALGRFGVLIVDDLGVEYHDDKMICRLDGLLDARSANGLSTIITTNLTAAEFERRYEARIWSRIYQFGDYVELDEPDLRITPIGAGRKL